MGLKKHPRLVVRQKGIGFTQYQFEFLEKAHNFDVNKLCRDAMDTQIKLIDPEFWEQLQNETST